MELEKNWGRILEVARQSKKANRFSSIATVDAQGNPHITPIGHVFFRSDIRSATQEEINLLQDSISITRFLKGHGLLWGNLTKVRDIKFYDFSPAKYPVMCENLWVE